VQWEHFPCEGTVNKQKTDPFVNAAKQIVTADANYHEVEFSQIQPLLPDLISATSYEQDNGTSSAVMDPVLELYLL